MACSQISGAESAQKLATVVTGFPHLSESGEPDPDNFVRSVASLSWLPGQDSNLSSRDQGCTGLAGLSQDPIWPPIMPYFGVPSPGPSRASRQYWKFAQLAVRSPGTILLQSVSAPLVACSLRWVTQPTRTCPGPLPTPPIRAGSSSRPSRLLAAQAVDRAEHRGDLTWVDSRHRED